MSWEASQTTAGRWCCRWVYLESNGCAGGAGKERGPDFRSAGCGSTYGIYDNQKIDMSNSWALAGTLFTHAVPCFSMQMPLAEACHVAVQRHPVRKQRLWRHMHARRGADGECEFVCGGWGAVILLNAPLRQLSSWFEHALQIPCPSARAPCSQLLSLHLYHAFYAQVPAAAVPPMLAAPPAAHAQAPRRCASSHSMPMPLTEALLLIWTSQSW
jgi:hypothetical protein